MISSRVVRASDSQGLSRNCPGFYPSTLRHSGLWGAADETVLNFIYKKDNINPQIAVKWMQINTAGSIPFFLPRLPKETTESLFLFFSSWGGGPLSPAQFGLRRQSYVNPSKSGFCSVSKWSAESTATLPPFSPIEGQKWFDQTSSQWESQKNRFTFISFGKSRFKPPTIWDQLFMTTVSVENARVHIFCW